MKNQLQFGAVKYRVEQDRMSEVSGVTAISSRLKDKALRTNMTDRSRSNYSNGPNDSQIDYHSNQVGGTSLNLAGNSSRQVVVQPQTKKIM